MNIYSVFDSALGINFLLFALARNVPKNIFPFIFIVIQNTFSPEFDSRRNRFSPLLEQNIIFFLPLLHKR